jgi:AraC family ethanolamine operon transcriptional activator
MSSDQILRYAVTRHFSDFEELADNVRAWDLDFRQLDAGESPAELTQIGFDKIQLTSAHFNRRYDQRGGAPSGTRTFGLLEEGVTGVTWCGRQVTDHTLLMFDASGSFDAVSQPGFKVFTFAVPVETLTNNAEALGVQNPEEVVQVGDSVLELTPVTARSIRQHMNQLKSAVTLDPTVLDHPEFIYELECALPGRLMETIAASKETPKKPVLRIRHLALKKAVDYINASTEQTITVNDLCRITGVSERTLQYVFIEHFGISPKRYVMNVRLNGVRKALIRAVPEKVTVSDIAHRFGFWHMSQFAADYRRLFGKLPSETLNKTSRTK